MIKLSALMTWTRFKECRQLPDTDYVEWQNAAAIPSAHRLVFVSHRWITPIHPDPDGAQLRELQQRLAALHQENHELENAVVFYDFCSLLQRPRTNDEEALFYRDLASLEGLSRQSDKFIILSEGYSDYKDRAWCFFEAATAGANVHYFDDQLRIRDDVQFFRDCLNDESPQITSYHFSYKPDVNEAEVIVAAFQHLQACRVTNADDLPLIKEQLVVHFNNRRITAFGRLIIALNKFFNVEFAIERTGRRKRNEAIVCKPFFSEPEWTRLPSIDDRARIMGGREGPSLFSLPPETLTEINGFIPLLRLSLPGVTDMKRFLEEFKNCRDWKQYVVPPIAALGKRDCFPTIDHVIHTVLERPPGFFCSTDLRHLFFYLVPVPTVQDVQKLLSSLNEKKESARPDDTEAQLEGSESALRGALAIGEQKFGPDHPSVARDLTNLAMVLRTMGRQAEAASLVLRAIVIFDHHRPAVPGGVRSEHPEMDAAIGNYRELAKELGWHEVLTITRLSDALKGLRIFDWTQDISCEDEAARKRRACSSLFAQANELMGRNQFDAAKPLYDDAERLARELNEGELLQRILGNRAGILVRSGNFDEALAILKQQEAICRDRQIWHGLVFALRNQAFIYDDELDERQRAFECLMEAHHVAKRSGLETEATQISTLLRQNFT